MAEDRIQDIQDYVSERLDALAQTAEHPQKAMLAKLRRGVGRAPGDLPELWGFFLEGLPEKWESRGGPPSREEWAVYLALTLYALHQQGRSTREEDGNMHKEGESLGRAIRKLLDPGNPPGLCAAGGGPLPPAEPGKRRACPPALGRELLLYAARRKCKRTRPQCARKGELR